MPDLAIYSKESNSYHRGIYPPMFIAVLFLREEMDQSRCLSTDELEKIQYICRVESLHLQESE